MGCTGEGQRMALRPEGEAQALVRCGRQSALKGICGQVHATFENWRMAGQYVDHEDLLQEFVRVALEKQTELYAKKRALLSLHSTDQVILTGIEKRLQALEP